MRQCLDEAHDKEYDRFPAMVKAALEYIDGARLEKNCYVLIPLHTHYH